MAAGRAIAQVFIRAAAGRRVETPAPTLKQHTRFGVIWLRVISLQFL
jgi:hypothetical protein